MLQRIHAQAAKEKSLVPAIPNVDFSMLGIDGVNGPDDVAKLIGGQVNDLIATGYPSQIGFGFETTKALWESGPGEAMGAVGWNLASRSNFSTTWTKGFEC